MFYLATLTATSLALKAASPVAAVFSPHDDQLFLRLAETIKSAHWLGEYDSLTLAKSAGYPVFLAAASALHIPVRLGEHLVYLLGSGLAAVALGSLAQRRWVTYLAYTALALNPVVFGGLLSRLLRDNLYVGLSLLTFASFAYVFLIFKRSKPRRRIETVASAAAGLTGGLFVLTREEAIWLVPSLGIIVLAAGLSAIASDLDKAGIRWRTLRSFAGTLAVVAVGFIVPILAVVAANWFMYRFPAVNDFGSGSFPAMYNAFARVEVAPRERYVPASLEARLAVYAVSPSAAELSPYLEGDIREAWVEHGCNQHQYSADPSLLPPSCGDYYVGWFPWALREAVEQAGHSGSSREAQQFMASVAAEVDAACMAGHLTCTPQASSLSAPIGNDDIAHAVRLLPHAFGRLTANQGLGQSSIGADEYLIHVAHFTNTAVSAKAGESTVVRARGWVAGKPSLPEVAFPALSQGGLPMSITRSGAEDVEAYFRSVGDADWLAVRFEVQADCADPDCGFTVVVPGGSEQRISMASLRPGAPAQEFLVGPGQELRMWIDAIERGPTSAAALADFTMSPPIASSTVMTVLTSVYQFVLPLATVAATIGSLGALLTGVRRRSGMLIVFTIAAGLAVVARLLLAAVLEVVAWPGALNDVYVLSASPFAIAFAVGGCVLLLRSVQFVFPRLTFPHEELPEVIQETS